MGGSGNWSDINHWVTTSGGNVYHAQLPGSSDDIFFDLNSGFSSGDTVFFTVQTNYCRHFNVNVPGQSPTFYGTNSNVLRVYGSVAMTTPVKWELMGTLFLESTNTETLSFSDTLRSVFFNSSGNWTASDTIIARRVIMDHGTLNLNNSGLFQCDTFQIHNGSTLNASNILLRFGYSQVDQNGTLNPSNIDIELQKPQGSWSNPYFRYYPNDSIHINRIQILQGNAEIYLKNVSIDTIQGGNYVNLTAIDSEIDYYNAGNPNVELTRSYINSPIDASAVQVRLYDHSQIPYIRSSNYAYVCVNTGCSTDSIIVANHLEIGGQSNIKIPLIRSNTLDIGYTCAGGTLSIGNLFTQGDISMSITANIDTLKMGYPATLTLNHSGTIGFEYFESLAPCDSTNKVESKTSFSAKTLNIAGGNISNTNFRDVVNNNVSNLYITSGNLTRTTGITSNNSNGTKFYWVGGSGSWNDLNHWSHVSGGSQTASCVPTILDTVVIDDNSGSSNFSIQLSSITEVAAFLDQTSQIEPTLNSNWSSIFRISNRFHCNNVNIGNSMYISLEGSYQNSTIRNPKGGGRYVLGTTGKWSQIDTVRSNNFYFFKGEFDQNEFPFYVSQNLSNDRDEHQSSVVGTVNWDLENAEAYIGRLSFSQGGSYNTNVGGSIVFLNNWQNHVVNDSINLNRVISNGSGGQFNLSGNVWNLQSLINSNDLNLGWGNCRLRCDTLVLESPSTVSSNSSIANDFVVGHFYPNSDCGNRLTMEGGFDWLPSAGPQTIPFGNFKNVNVTKDSIIALSSTDLGGNNNVVFTPDQPRTLYWVNDGGSWNDSIHWSLSSGGIGGECLPTPIDSVVFDQNSFVNSHSVSINNTNAFAHDIIVDSAGWASFNGNKSMQFYGSLIVHDSIYISPWGNGWIGETDNLDSIYLSSGRLGNFALKGKSWRLPTNIVVANQFSNYADSTYLDSGIIINNLYSSFNNYGRLYSQYNLFQGSSFYNNGVWYDSNSVLNLSSSLSTSGTTYNSHSKVECNYLNFGGNDTLIDGFYEADYQIEIGNTSHLVNDSLISHQEYRINGTYSDSNTFHFLHHDSYLNPQWGQKARLYMQTSDSVGNFRFEGVNQAYYYHTGSGCIKTLYLMDNSLLYGSPKADSLFFYAGNTYEIESGQTLHINEYFNAFGTFCDYLYVRSDDQGTRSYIDADFQVFTNFCEYRDIEYTGNSTYYAGSQSTDQGNNYNLIWDNIPGYIWGFPSDTLVFFCNDTSVYSEFILGTETFQNALSYLWDDGSDSTHRVITQSGLYSVTAYYATCSYTDSIQVNFIHKPDLSAEKFLVCKGDSINVFSQTPIGIDLVWSNGSSKDTTGYLVVGDTTIVVQWFQGGGFLCSDSLEIEGVSIDATVTAASNPKCADTQDGQIDIMNVYGGHGPYNFNWSHSPSLMDSTASGLIGGCYYITTIDTLSCSRIDTICLMSPPPLYANFALTQPECQGDPGSAVIGATGGVPPYSFSYSFNAASIPAGNHTYIVTDTNGCITDTSFDISHTYNFDYVVIVDTATCGDNNGGIEVIPNSTPNSYTYSWSNYPGFSMSGQIFMGSSNGFIYITDSISGCLDTVYYEIPTAGAANANFLLDREIGICPLTVQTINLVNNPGIIDYWILDGDTVSSQQDTLFTFSRYGTYVLKHCVYDPKYDCLSCSEKLITVLPNPLIEIPNLFSPNNDGVNDYFKLVVGQDLEAVALEVYNRWGALVFRSNEIDFRWDGNALNGNKCSDGVYFWVLTYKEAYNDEVIHLRGDVTLMR